MDSSGDHWKPRSENLPDPVDLGQVKWAIEQLGIRIDEGPFLNREYLLARGIPMVRVKCTLSPEELRVIGVKSSVPKKTSLRFLIQEDGGITHVRSSERKKSSADYRRQRRQRRTQ
jgi:hypothetical protein